MATKKTTDLDIVEADDVQEIIVNTTAAHTGRSPLGSVLERGVRDLDLGVLADQAEDSSQEAANQAAQAQLIANAPRNQQLPGGGFSSYHWSEEAKDASIAAANLSEIIIDNSVSSPLVLTQEHKYQSLVFTRTTALTVQLPPNWHTDVALDGKPSRAWVNMLRLGSGLITIAAASGSSVVNPSMLTNQVFTYKSNPVVVGYVGSHVLTVPAGINRRLFVGVTTMYAAGKTRTDVLTISNASAVTKQASTTAAQSSAGGTAPVAAQQWTATLADSTVSTNHTISYTPNDDAYCYVIAAIAFANGDEWIDAKAYQGSTLVTDSAMTLTSVEDNSIAIALQAFKGVAANPVSYTTPASPVVLSSGKTPGTEEGRDLSYLFGYKLIGTAGATVYNAHHGVTAGQKPGGTGVILQPNNVVTSSVNLISPGGATLAAIGAMSTIWARSDGITFIKTDGG